MSFLCSCAGRRRKRSESDDRQEYYRRRSASHTPPPPAAAATPKVKRKFPTGIAPTPSVPSDLEENSAAVLAAAKNTSKPGPKTKESKFKNAAAKAKDPTPAIKVEAPVSKFKDTAKAQFDAKKNLAGTGVPVLDKCSRGTMTAPGSGEVTGYEQTILPRVRKKSAPVVSARMEVTLKSTRRPEPIAIATQCDDVCGSSGSDTPRGYEASISSSDVASGSPRDAQTQCSFSDFSDDESSLLSLGREEGEYESTVSEYRDPSADPGKTGEEIWDPAFLQHDRIWMDIKSTLMDLISDKDSPAFHDLHESMKPDDLTYCTVFRKMDGTVTHKAREDRRKARHSFGGIPADKIPGSRGKTLRDTSEPITNARRKGGRDYGEKLYTPDDEVTEYYFGRRSSSEPEVPYTVTERRLAPDAAITEFYFGQGSSSELDLARRSESQITLRSFPGGSTSETLRKSLHEIWSGSSARDDKYGGSAAELTVARTETQLPDKEVSSPVQADTAADQVAMEIQNIRDDVTEVVVSEQQIALQEHQNGSLIKQEPPEPEKAVQAEVKMRQKVTSGIPRPFDRSLSESSSSSSSRIGREGTPVVHDLKAQKEIWRQGIAFEGKDFDVDDADLESMEVEPVSTEAHEKNRQHPKRVTRRKDTSELRSFSLDYEKRSPKVVRKRPGRPIVAQPYSSTRTNQPPPKDHSKHKLKLKREHRIDSSEDPYETGCVETPESIVVTGENTHITVQDNKVEIAASDPNDKNKLVVNPSPAPALLDEGSTDIVESTTGLRSPGVVRSIIAGRFRSSKTSGKVQSSETSSESENNESNIRIPKPNVDIPRETENLSSKSVIESAKKLGSKIPMVSKQKERLEKHPSLLPEIDAESRFVSKPSEVKRSGKIELISPPPEEEEDKEETKNRRTKKTRNVSRFLPRGGLKDQKNKDETVAEVTVKDTSNVDSDDQMIRQVSEGSTTEPDLVIGHGSPHLSIDEQLSKFRNSLEDSVSKGSPDVIVQCFGDVSSNVDEKKSPELSEKSSFDDLKKTENIFEKSVTCFSAPSTSVETVVSALRTKTESWESEMKNSVDVKDDQSPSHVDTDNTTETNVSRKCDKAFELGNTGFSGKELFSSSSKEENILQPVSVKEDIERVDSFVADNISILKSNFELAGNSEIQPTLESEKNEKILEQSLDSANKTIDDTVNKIKDETVSVSTKVTEIVNPEKTDVNSLIVGASSPSDVTKNTEVKLTEAILQPFVVATNKTDVNILSPIRVSETAVISSSSSVCLSDESVPCIPEEKVPLLSPTTSSPPVSPRSASVGLDDVSSTGSECTSPKRYSSGSDSVHPLLKVETTVDKTPLGSQTLPIPRLVEPPATTRTPRVRLSDIVITGSGEEKLLALNENIRVDTSFNDNRSISPALEQTLHPTLESKIKPLVAPEDQVIVDKFIMPIANSVDVTTTNLPSPVTVLDTPSIDSATSRISERLIDKVDTSVAKSSEDTAEIVLSQEKSLSDDVLDSLRDQSDSVLPTIRDSETLSNIADAFKSDSTVPDTKNNEVDKGSKETEAKDNKEPKQKVVEIIEGGTSTDIKSAGKTENIQRKDKSVDEPKESGINNEDKHAEVKEKDETKEKSPEKSAKAEGKSEKTSSKTKKSTKSDKKNDKTDKKSEKSDKKSGKAVKSNAKSEIPSPPPDRPIRIAVRPSERLRSLSKSSSTTSPPPGLLEAVDPNAKSNVKNSEGNLEKNIDDSNNILESKNETRLDDVKSPETYSHETSVPEKEGEAESKSLRNSAIEFMQNVVGKVFSKGTEISGYLGYTDLVFSRHTSEEVPDSSKASSDRDSLDDKLLKEKLEVLDREMESSSRDSLEKEVLKDKSKMSVSPLASPRDSLDGARSRHDSDLTTDSLRDSLSDIAGKAKSQSSCDSLDEIHSRAISETVSEKSKYDANVRDTDASLAGTPRDSLESSPSKIVLTSRDEPISDSLQDLPSNILGKTKSPSPSDSLEDSTFKKVSESVTEKSKIDSIIRQDNIDQITPRVSPESSPLKTTPSAVSEPITRGSFATSVDEDKILNFSSIWSPRISVEQGSVQPGDIPILESVVSDTISDLSARPFMLPQYSVDDLSLLNSLQTDSPISETVVSESVSDLNARPFMSPRYSVDDLSPPKSLQTDSPVSETVVSDSVSDLNARPFLPPVYSEGESAAPEIRESIPEPSRVVEITTEKIDSSISESEQQSPLESLCNRVLSPRPGPSFVESLSSTRDSFGGLSKVSTKDVSGQLDRIQSEDGTFKDDASSVSSVNSPRDSLSSKRESSTTVSDSRLSTTDTSVIDDILGVSSIPVLKQWAETDSAKVSGSIPDSPPRKASLAVEEGLSSSSATSPRDSIEENQAKRILETVPESLQLPSKFGLSRNTTTSLSSQSTPGGSFDLDFSRRPSDYIPEIPHRVSLAESVSHQEPLRDSFDSEKVSSPKISQREISESFQKYLSSLSPHLSDFRDSRISSGSGDSRKSGTSDSDFDIIDFTEPDLVVLSDLPEERAPSGLAPFQSEFVSNLPGNVGTQSVLSEGFDLSYIDTSSFDDDKTPRPTSGSETSPTREVAKVMEELASVLENAEKALDSDTSSVDSKQSIVKDHKDLEISKEKEESVPEKLESRSSVGEIFLGNHAEKDHQVFHKIVKDQKDPESLKEKEKSVPEKLESRSSVGETFLGNQAEKDHQVFHKIAESSLDAGVDIDATFEAMVNSLLTPRCSGIADQDTVSEESNVKEATTVADSSKKPTRETVVTPEEKSYVQKAGDVTSHADHKPPCEERHLISEKGFDEGDKKDKSVAKETDRPLKGGETNKTRRKKFSDEIIGETGLRESSFEVAKKVQEILKRVPSIEAQPKDTSTTHTEPVPRDMPIPPAISDNVETSTLVLEGLGISTEENLTKVKSDRPTEQSRDFAVPKSKESTETNKKRDRKRKVPGGDAKKGLKEGDVSTTSKSPEESNDTTSVEKEDLVKDEVKELNGSSNEKDIQNEHEEKVTEELVVPKDSTVDVVSESKSRVCQDTTQQKIAEECKDRLLQTPKSEVADQESKLDSDVINDELLVGKSEAQLLVPDTKKDLDDISKIEIINVQQTIREEPEEANSGNLKTILEKEPMLSEKNKSSEIFSDSSIKEQCVQTDSKRRSKAKSKSTIRYSDVPLNAPSVTFEKNIPLPPDPEFLDAESDAASSKNKTDKSVKEPSKPSDVEDPSIEINVCPTELKDNVDEAEGNVTDKRHAGDWSKTFSLDNQIIFPKEICEIKLGSSKSEVRRTVSNETALKHDTTVKSDTSKLHSKSLEQPVVSSTSVTGDTSVAMTETLTFTPEIVDKVEDISAISSTLPSKSRSVSHEDKAIDITVSEEMHSQSGGDKDKTELLNPQEQDVQPVSYDDTLDKNEIIHFKSTSESIVESGKAEDSGVEDDDAQEHPESAKEKKKSSKKSKSRSREDVNSEELADLIQKQLQSVVDGKVGDAQIELPCPMRRDKKSRKSVKSSSSRSTSIEEKDVIGSCDLSVNQPVESSHDTQESADDVVRLGAIEIQSPKDNSILTESKSKSPEKDAILKENSKENSLSSTSILDDFHYFSDKSFSKPHSILKSSSKEKISEPSWAKEEEIKLAEDNSSLIFDDPFIVLPKREMTPTSILKRSDSKSSSGDDSSFLPLSGRDLDQSKDDNLRESKDKRNIIRLKSRSSSREDEHPLSDTSFVDEKFVTSVTESKSREGMEDFTEPLSPRSFGRRFTSKSVSFEDDVIFESVYDDIAECYPGDGGESKKEPDSSFEKLKKLERRKSPKKKTKSKSNDEWDEPATSMFGSSFEVIPEDTSVFPESQLQEESTKYQQDEVTRGKPESRDTRDLKGKLHRKSAEKDSSPRIELSVEISDSDSLGVIEEPSEANRLSVHRRSPKNKSKSKSRDQDDEVSSTSYLSNQRLRQRFVVTPDREIARTELDVLDSLLEEQNSEIVDTVMKVRSALEGQHISFDSPLPPPSSSEEPFSPNIEAEPITSVVGEESCEVDKSRKDKIERRKSPKKKSKSKSGKEGEVIVLNPPGLLVEDHFSPISESEQKELEGDMENMEIPFTKVERRRSPKKKSKSKVQESEQFTDPLRSDGATVIQNTLAIPREEQLDCGDDLIVLGNDKGKLQTQSKIERRKSPKKKSKSKNNNLESDIPDLPRSSGKSFLPTVPAFQIDVGEPIFGVSSTEMPSSQIPLAETDRGSGDIIAKGKEEKSKKPESTLNSNEQLVDSPLQGTLLSHEIEKEEPNSEKTEPVEKSEVSVQSEIVTINQSENITLPSTSAGDCTSLAITTGPENIDPKTFSLSDRITITSDPDENRYSSGHIPYPNAVDFFTTITSSRPESMESQFLPSRSSLELMGQKSTESNISWSFPPKVDVRTMFVGNVVSPSKTDDEQFEYPAGSIIEASSNGDLKLVDNSTLVSPLITSSADVSTVKSLSFEDKLKSYREKKKSSDDKFGTEDRSNLSCLSKDSTASEKSLELEKSRSVEESTPIVSPPIKELSDSELFKKSISRSSSTSSEKKIFKSSHSFEKSVDTCEVHQVMSFDKENFSPVGSPSKPLSRSSSTSESVVSKISRSFEKSIDLTALPDVHKRQVSSGSHSKTPSRSSSTTSEKAIIRSSSIPEEVEFSEKDDLVAVTQPQPVSRSSSTFSDKEASKMDLFFENVECLEKDSSDLLPHPKPASRSSSTISDKSVTKTSSFVDESGFSGNNADSFRPKPPSRSSSTTSDKSVTKTSSFGEESGFPGNNADLFRPKAPSRSGSTTSDKSVTKTSSFVEESGFSGNNADLFRPKPPSRNSSTTSDKSVIKTSSFTEQTEFSSDTPRVKPPVPPRRISSTSSDKSVSKTSSFSEQSDLGENQTDFPVQPRPRPPVPPRRTTSASSENLKSKTNSLDEDLQILSKDDDSTNQPQTSRSGSTISDKPIQKASHSFEEVMESLITSTEVSLEKITDEAAADVTDPIFTTRSENIVSSSTTTAGVPIAVSAPLRWSTALPENIDVLLDTTPAKEEENVEIKEDQKSIPMTEAANSEKRSPSSQKKTPSSESKTVAESTSPDTERSKTKTKTSPDTKKKTVPEKESSNTDRKSVSKNIPSDNLTETKHVIPKTKITETESKMSLTEPKTFSPKPKPRSSKSTASDSKIRTLESQTLQTNFKAENSVDQSTPPETKTRAAPIKSSSPPDTETASTITKTHSKSKPLDMKSATSDPKSRVASSKSSFAETKSSAAAAKSAKGAGDVVKSAVRSALDTAKELLRVDAPRRRREKSRSPRPEDEASSAPAAATAPAPSPSARRRRARARRRAAMTVACDRGSDIASPLDWAAEVDAELPMEMEEEEEEAAAGAAVPGTRRKRKRHRRKRAPAPTAPATTTTAAATPTAAAPPGVIKRLKSCEEESADATDTAHISRTAESGIVRTQERERIRSPPLSPRDDDPTPWNVVRSRRQRKRLQEHRKSRSFEGEGFRFQDPARGVRLSSGSDTGDASTKDVFYFAGREQGFRK